MGSAHKGPRGMPRLHILALHNLLAYLIPKCSRRYILHRAHGGLTHAAPPTASTVNPKPTVCPAPIPDRPRPAKAGGREPAGACTAQVHPPGAPPHPVGGGRHPRGVLQPPVVLQGRRSPVHAVLLVPAVLPAGRPAAAGAQGVKRCGVRQLRPASSQQCPPHPTPPHTAIMHRLTHTSRCPWITLSLAHAARPAGCGAVAPARLQARGAHDCRRHAGRHDQGPAPAAGGAAAQAGAG